MTGLGLVLDSHATGTVTVVGDANVRYTAAFATLSIVKGEFQTGLFAVVPWSETPLWRGSTASMHVSITPL